MLTEKEKEQIIEKVKKLSMYSTFGYIIKEHELDGILVTYTEDTNKLRKK